MVPVRIAATVVVAVAMLAPTAKPQQAPESPVSPRVAELIKQLKDPDWDTRMEAAAALGALRGEARAAIPDLLEALKDPVPAVRMKAIDAFMFMRTDAAEAAPRIVPFLADPDELVRVSAVVALPRVTPDRASTVPLLKSALADKAWPVRREAAIGLIQLGEELAAAVPVLREGLNDPIPSKRLEAIGVLAKVGSPEQRKSMTAIAAGYLKDPDPETRVEAIRQLSALGSAAVPPLIGVLKAEDEAHEVQLAAVRGLGRIGPDAEAALPLLRELQQRKGMWLYFTRKAIAAIEGKGPRLPEEVTGPVPPLSGALPSPSPTPR
jgi:HEAT repeat protein